MLTVQKLYKSYDKQGHLWGKERLPVLQGIDLVVKTGQCVGLVGESGNGKSTLSRAILGLEKPDDGEVLMEGKPILQWRKAHRGEMSVVFQDYTASVNPHFSVSAIIEEPLLALGKRNNQEQIDALLQQVGLPDRVKNRLPHELSGGQLQRVCIARAIATQPRFLVLDEAISSLDVSVQAQVLQLLKQLRESLQMTYFFITHDLQAVAYLCDEVLFLYQGKIVERIACERLYDVQHGYAKKLLAAVMPFTGRKL